MDFMGKNFAFKKNITFLKKFIVLQPKMLWRLLTTYFVCKRQKIIVKKNDWPKMLKNGLFCCQNVIKSIIFFKKSNFLPKIGQFWTEISEILEINKNLLNTPNSQILGHLKYFSPKNGHFRPFLGHFWPY